MTLLSCVRVDENASVAVRDFGISIRDLGWITAWSSGISVHSRECAMILE